MTSSRSWIWYFCLLTYVCFLSTEGAIEIKGVPKYIVRKCCASNEYYNLQLQKCVKGGNLSLFEALVDSHLVKGNVRKLGIVTGRLMKCPDTKECFETTEIISDKTHTLLTNGMIFENFFGVTYDMRNYCLESVGHGSQNVSLAFAYCLPETNVLPKCCPDNHFFDDKNFQCLKYPRNDRSENLLSTFLYFKNDKFIQYDHDLECTKTFPIRYTLLRDAYIDECSNICINNPRQCYSIRKFCVDGAFTNRLVPSVYVCADNITKVCCKDEYYDEHDLPCSCSSYFAM